MELANSIVDTLIIYTEAMAFYWFIAALVIYVDKKIDEYQMIHTQGDGYKGLQQILDSDHLFLPGAPVTALLEPASPELEHVTVPFNSQSYRSYWMTWTCRQLRNYLQDLGYTKLSKLRKDDLIELAKVV